MFFFTKSYINNTRFGKKTIFIHSQMYLGGIEASFSQTVGEFFGRQSWPEK
jgi:hypothetical protein